MYRESKIALLPTPLYPTDHATALLQAISDSQQNMSISGFRDIATDIMNALDLRS
jgi:hypothetical protein